MGRLIDLLIGLIKKSNYFFVSFSSDSELMF